MKYNKKIKWYIYSTYFNIPTRYYYNLININIYSSCVIFKFNIFLNLNISLNNYYNIYYNIVDDTWDLTFKIKNIKLHKLNISTNYIYLNKVFISRMAIHNKAILDGDFYNFIKDIDNLNIRQKEKALNNQSLFNFNISNLMTNHLYYHSKI